MNIKKYTEIQRNNDIFLLLLLLYHAPTDAFVL